MKKTTLLLITFLLVLSACTGTATSTSKPEPVSDIDTIPVPVTAEGKLLPAHGVELAFPQAGIIHEVLVKPGEKVDSGDVLARLTGIEAVQAELAAAQLEQTTAQQVLDTLHRTALLTASQVEKSLQDAQKAFESESSGWSIGNSESATDLELSLDDYIASEEDYRDARDKLDDQLHKDKADRERKDAQDDFDRESKILADAYAALLKDVAANGLPLNNKQVKLLNTIAALEVARENQSRLDEGNLDPEKLAAVESALSAATAHVSAAEATLELYELRAPIEGTVLSLDLNEGETALPGIPVAYLADTTSWIVETKDLAEIDITRITPGQIATVKLDAFPGEEFTATVSAIDPVGKEYLGDMTYKVTVTLDNADERFMWFMTATVNIPTAE